MNRLNLSLRNCFGIRKMKCDIDFTSCNACAIYARNGMMKTSFSNTFQCIQENKSKEIRDKIFDIPGDIEAKVDGDELNPEEVFVIKSYERYYESKHLAALLVDSSLKSKIKSLLDRQMGVFYALSKKSGLKLEKTVSGKKVQELESVIIHDFHLPNGSFLLNLDKIEGQLKLEDEEEEITLFLSDIKYNDIFDESILKKIILSDEFQSHINDFLEQVKNICKEYPFLQAGELTLPGLDKISKELKKNRFFVNQNRLYLNGDLLIEDAKTLDNTIEEITDRINRVDELKKLSKYLSDVKGMTLRRLLETHHNIVPYLTKNKIDELRILLWKSYFTELKDDFQSLKEEYEQVRKLLQKGNFKQSPWEHALMIFNERFSVPFEMRIANYESAVLGESLPRVEFYFRKDNADLQDSSCDIAISRDRLEELGTLSQGERRALYLLNIIFDIEQRNLAKQKTLYIIDDIADSFDYKNKYAIIEYLLDLKNNPLNHLIVLSHNFDFYRTVASRLNLVRKNRLIALLTDQDEIQLQEEKYQKHPFTPWRNHTESPDNFIALIPFVRNLIEYGYDYRILEDKFLRSDSDVLTSLLHIKSITRDITVKDVAKLYEFYLFGIDSNTAGIGEKVKIDKYEDNTLLIDLIQKQAKEVGPNDTQLEYKIILSIAIRLITEEFIINKINENEDFKEPTSNQTRYLLDKMRKLYPGLRKEILRIFDAVNIVTPEQIHFNSFMYEPLVDMDILELLQLYQAVNKLDELWEENNE